METWHDKVMDGLLLVVDELYTTRESVRDRKYKRAFSEVESALIHLDETRVFIRRLTKGYKQRG